jgi:hypothetical protein
VLAVVAWRLVTGRNFGAAQRVAAAALALVVVLVIAVVAALGPLRPGWSHRSGTSGALLARIAGASAGAPVPTVTTPATTGAPATTGGSPSSSGPAPAAPFSLSAAGSQATESLGDGRVRITLSLHLDDEVATPLTIVLEGGAVPGGGVSLTQGTVRLGSDEGTVTALDGNRVDAVLTGDEAIDLAVTLRVDQATGALTASATGTRGGG